MDLNDLLDIESNQDLLHQCPPPQKFKKSYDSICKFQLEWVEKLPWVEGVFNVDGILQNVQCRVCNTIDRKLLLFPPKWDTLMKHEGRRKVNKDLPQLGVKVGEWYTNKTSKHKKNQALYTT